MSVLLRSLLVAGFCVSVDVSAHHPVVVEFDLSQNVTMQGKMHGLEMTNPHPSAYLKLNDGRGCRLLLPAPHVLLRLDSEQKLLSAEVIEVVGYPRKDAKKCELAVESLRVETG